MQRHHRVQYPDSYFPSMIGYIHTALFNIATTPRHFNDRSPLNPYEWHVLWKLMSATITRQSSYQSAKESLMLMKNTYYYQDLRSKFNGIAIINSNCDQVDALRAQRNEGSDKERSKWKMYTPLQNLMYQILYPDLYIDLAWFEDCSTDDICMGIATFLEYAIKHKPSKLDCSLAQRLIESNVRLPSAKIDYVSMNFDTHCYRQMGRVYTKAAVNDDNVTENTLVECFPKCLDITKLPMQQSILMPQPSLSNEVLSKDPVDSANGLISPSTYWNEMEEMVSPSTCWSESEDLFE